MVRRTRWFGVGPRSCIVGATVALAALLCGCGSPLSRVADKPTVIARAGEGLRFVATVRWSPDGRHLLALRKRTSDPPRYPWASLVVIDVVGWTATQLGHCSVNPTPIFSPDGLRILLSPSQSGSPALAYRDLGTGQDTIVYQFEGRKVMLAASSSPGGDTVAVSYSDFGAKPADIVDTVGLIDPDAHSVRILDHPLFGMMAFSSRFDLAWTDKKGDREYIQIARPPDYSITRIGAPFPLNAVDEASWSPDGRCLLVASLGDPPLLVEALDVETRRSTEVLRVAGLQYNYGIGMGWSPDGSLIAVGGLLPQDTGLSPEYVLFHAMADKAADSAKRIGPLPTTRAGCGLAWSPKGDAVAYPCEDTIQMIRVKPASG